MIELEFSQLIKNIDIKNSSNLQNVRGGFKGLATDTRLPSLAGHLFVPLVGDRFDAHSFVPQAVEKGAAAVFYHNWDEAWEPLASKCLFFQVEDTLRALQDLAHFWRKKHKALVVGLTGSNGKTTTKDFASQIFSQQGETVASQGSYNNHWGVPLTLLKISQQTKYAIVEMGMNHPGEITELNKIARPDKVCVTNVGRAHLGFFKNVEEIAQAKREIYSTADASCDFIFNIDNPHTLKMYQEAWRQKKTTYSLKNKQAQVCFDRVESQGKGFRIQGTIGGVPGDCEVKFWGQHNVENLAAASALAFSAGISPQDIWSSLPKCHTGWGRNQWIQGQGGASVLFDGYNANPDSFAALLKNLEPLFAQGEKPMGVFGTMLELGDQSEEAHLELGRLLQKYPWHKLIFIGHESKNVARGWGEKNRKSLIITDTYEEVLALNLPSMLQTDSFIVVKGSRGQRLERVVELFEPINFS